MRVGRDAEKTAPASSRGGRMIDAPLSGERRPCWPVRHGRPGVTSQPCPEKRDYDPGARGPLQGIRVLDLSRVRGNV